MPWEVWQRPQQSDDESAWQCVLRLDEPDHAALVMAMNSLPAGWEGKLVTPDAAPSPPPVNVAAEDDEAQLLRWQRRIALGLSPDDPRARGFERTRPAGTCPDCASWCPACTRLMSRDEVRELAESLV